jgi:hypothetical protein
MSPEQFAREVARLHEAEAYEKASDYVFGDVDDAAEALAWAIDKIDGLEADLDSAVEVAWRRGAIDWVRMNYPKHYERLTTAENQPA